MQLIRRANATVLENPGDYVIVFRCAFCNAHGNQESVPLHYRHCENPVIKPAFIIRCKCDQIWSSHETHVVNVQDPLDVNPSWKCPNGCHALLRNGVWVTS